MQLNDKGEVIWEPPHPSVVALVKPHTRSGIWERLQADMDRVLADPEPEECK